MAKVVAFAEAWARNMNAHFIFVLVRSAEAVKLLILDFFLAAQRFLVKINPFFEVIAMFFYKVRRCVTSKPDQGFVYYSWSEHKARCPSDNKANRVLSWCTGWQGISHCIPFVFKVLGPRTLLCSLLFLSFCTGIPGENREKNVFKLHLSCCEMPLMAERSLGNKPDDQLSLCTLTDNGHKRKLKRTESLDPLWSQTKWT